MQKSERKNLEVLAPAGNMEALICAVNNGANAVYLGLKQFNARAKAGNFTYEELTEAVRYAHFFGVRIYVTFNVIYKKSEYNDVTEAIKKCKGIGVDAFILQDFAFICHIRTIMPDIVIHLSTQAGIHNLDGAICAEKLGVTRIILSREVLVEDIIKIRKNTSLEIECFVQGALCIGFSGNCYFSSIVSGYSGNRGKCLQLCRKKYTFKGKQAYWLSPKDINLSDEMSKLINAGVTSFKIEGRMRRPEYVGEAVKCYKSAIDKEPYDISRLKRLFNRGDYTKVYISSPRNNVIHEKTQNHVGYEVGQVVKITPKRLTHTANLNKGDGIKIFRNGNEVGTALVSDSGNSTTYVGNVKVGDTINVTTDLKLNNEITSTRRFVEFDLFAEITDNFVKFSVVSGQNSATKMLHDIVLAKTSALDENQILDCFNKTNDYNLKLNNAKIDIKSNVFIPKSALNAIRRELCEKLVDEILNSYKNNDISGKFNNVFAEIDAFEGLDRSTIFQTDSIETANYCKDYFDYVAYFPRFYSLGVLSEIEKSQKPVLLVLPNVARGEDVEIISKILQSDSVKHVIVNNLYGLNLAKGKKILLGPFMNVIDDAFNCRKILSVEASPVNRDSDYVYFYGNFPIMTYSHCPINAYYGKCINCNNDYNDKLIDEKGSQFPLLPYKIKYCYSYLLNDRPVNLTKLNYDFKKKVVDLVGIDKEKAYNILKSIAHNEKIEGGTLVYYNKNLE